MIEPWDDVIFQISSNNKNHFYLKINKIINTELCIFNDLSQNPIKCSLQSEVIDVEV
jgi:hypothetical protein